MSLTKVAIAYHSGYGHTGVVAEAVADGAREVADTEVTVVKVSEITDEQWNRLDDADAIIFGSAVYMGSHTAEFQKFSEASSSRWFERKWAGKIAGVFVNSSNLSGDKVNAQQSIGVLAAQHGMVLFPQTSSVAGLDADDVNRLGFSIGVGTQVGAVEGPDAMTKGDLETARLHGRNIAEFTKVVNAGRAAVA